MSKAEPGADRRPSNDHRESSGPDMTGLSKEQRRELVARMRVPLVTFVALLLCLATNLAMGWLHPSERAWMIEGPVMVLMIVAVLLYSMEVIHDPPLVRFFSVLGFCWVAILFTMTLIDYSTR